MSKCRDSSQNVITREIITILIRNRYKYFNMEGKGLKIRNRSRHQIRINLAVATDLVKANRLRKLTRHNLFKTT